MLRQIVMLAVPLCLMSICVAALASYSSAKDAIRVDLQSGDVMFEDSLQGSAGRGWKIAPANFKSIAEIAPAYLLELDKDGYPVSPAVVGDTSWGAYRVEVEFYSMGGGWAGIDFHMQDDTQRGCNVSVYPVPEANAAVFEAAAWCSKTAFSWKLYPAGQRKSTVKPTCWNRLKIDVGRTVANVYLDGDPKPVYTVYDMPFRRGGVRFMAYYAPAAFRNLRVTCLAEEDVRPILEDPWADARRKSVVRGWQVSAPMPLKKIDALATDPLQPLVLDWQEAVTDGRGVVDLTRQFSDFGRKGAVFAKRTVSCDVAREEVVRLTYTDRLKMWCNGKLVFDGPPFEATSRLRKVVVGGRVVEMDE